MSWKYDNLVLLLGLLLVFSLGGCRGEEGNRDLSSEYSGSRSVKFVELKNEGVGQGSQGLVRSDQAVFSNLYKTPSGKKYHTADCYLVNNVSLKLDGKDDILKHGLSPCKKCSPPSVGTIQGIYSPANKAVGESALVQCSGQTKTGRRCRRKTRLGNGRCFQHGG